MTKELLHLGLLTRIDRGVLATYCEAWARWIKAEEMIQKDGEVIEGRQKGLVKSPWVRVATDAMEQIRRIGIEFGLTPSSRGRLQVPGQKLRPLDEIAKERAEANRAQWEREKKKGS